MAMIGRSCLLSSCRIIHFGINPVSGGRPPSDSIIRAAPDARIGFLDQAVASVLTLVAINSFMVRNAAEVIIIYVSRASSVRWGAYWITITIQPIWAIEEYARILRSWVWFSPPQPPTNVDITPSAVSSSGSRVCAVWVISANGASFCQVERIRPVDRSKPCITSGIQKCMGASPILSARATVNIMLAMGLDRSLMAHSPVSQALVVLANRIIAAAVAWVKKYLVVASTARG